MATRKKGAAGIAPAAASKAEAPANPATVTADTAGGDVAGQALAAALGDGAIEGVSGTVQAALGEGDAAIAAAVAFAQQPGQIASVLEAPVLATDAPEGGVLSEITVGTELLADGHPAEIELGGRTVMVQARAERGRWRIGRQFTRDPQPVNIDELTEDEVGRLLADPELIVSLDD